MLRNALIALAGTTAIALAAPLAAQGQTAAQPAPATQEVAAQPAAQAPATAPAADATNAKEDSAKPSAKKAGRVIRTGPNKGMVVGADTVKDKTKTDDAAKKEEPQTSENPQR